MQYHRRGGAAPPLGVKCAVRHRASIRFHFQGAWSAMVSPADSWATASASTCGAMWRQRASAFSDRIGAAFRDLASRAARFSLRDLREIVEVVEKHVFDFGNRGIDVPGQRLIDEESAREGRFCIAALVAAERHDDIRGGRRADDDIEFASRDSRCSKGRAVAAQGGGEFHRPFQPAAGDGQGGAPRL